MTDNSKKIICDSQSEGFTLMEVVVAIAILGVSFVLVMQLFSGGLRLSRASCDYTRAVVHAKNKMEQVSSDPAPASGEFDDGFKWEVEVEPYEEREELSLSLLKIKVKILWADAVSKQRSIELVSLRTVPVDDNR